MSAALVDRLNQLMVDEMIFVWHNILLLTWTYLGEDVVVVERTSGQEKVSTYVKHFAIRIYPLDQSILLYTPPIGTLDIYESPLKFCLTLIPLQKVLTGDYLYSLLDNFVQHLKDYFNYPPPIDDGPPPAEDKALEDYMSEAWWVESYEELKRKFGANIKFTLKEYRLLYDHISDFLPASDTSLAEEPPKDEEVPPSSPIEGTESNE